MILCLVVGVVMVALILLLIKFFKEKFMKLSTIIRCLSFALAIVLLGFFYVFPFGTMLVKIFLGVF
jgi:hypothetical protein